MTLRLAALAQGGPRRLVHAVLALVLLAPLAACGKKGPPLAPLRLAPDTVTDVVTRRADGAVRIRFVVPTKNLGQEGPVNIAKVEVYAATVAAGADAPPNREFLKPKYLVGAVEVKPPVAAGEAPAVTEAKTAADTRPGPGEVAVFVEELTPDKQVPQFSVMPVVPAATPTPLMRIYALRGVSRAGHPGQVATRIHVPLTAPPDPPSAVTSTVTESVITLSWTPPEQTAQAPKVAGYNVYGADPQTPLNATPLVEPSLARPGVEYGQEQCFVVRSVVVQFLTVIESAPSEKHCVTPADTFPPAAPTGLSAVATGGAINLIWTANTEADLAGYLVLRGEAPGEKLQAVTPSPIQGTTYRDTGVTPGVRYVYVIVAVDRATPPNVSGQSTRVEETAR